MTAVPAGTPGPDVGRVLVVIPTYNERDNLEAILGRVRAAVPDAHVLVVDDSSPDGTGKLAEELAAADEQIQVLHRTEKNGLGQAYIGGYRAYRADVLRALSLDEVSSQGYCFQVDLVRRTWQAGFRVVEVPITFAERERGQSKMSGSIVREALWRVTLWGLSSRPGAARRRALAARTPAGT